MPNPKVTLLIPTHNELGGMKVIMPKIKKEWVDQILVVDGGDDGTYEYAVAQGYDTIKQSAPGLPAAYDEAFLHAKGDIIILFSPDGNSVPELIPQLIEKMKEGDYDMVIVSRYLPPAKSEDDDIITGFGNWMFTTMINVLYSSHYTDTLVIYRAFKKSLLKYSDGVKMGRTGHEPYFSIVAAKYKLKVAEIPGDEPPRIYGKRKMSPLGNGWAILVLIWLERFKPRRFDNKGNLLK